MNLIPQNNGRTPNYWCTWATQNFVDEWQPDTGSSALAFVGDQGMKKAFNHLNEALVFGKNGWIRDWQGIRGDLYFMFDAGWDLPYGVYTDQLYRFGSLELDPERFPSCPGNPAERLRKLNHMVKAAGWRGAGLWIAAQAAGEGLDNQTLTGDQEQQYWIQRLKWSADAGIEYWKVDFGYHNFSHRFRQMLTRLGKQYAPQLLIEHGRGCMPLNGTHINPDGTLTGSFRYDGEVAQNAIELLTYSDVNRIYDLIVPMAIVSAIDRTAYMLRHYRRGNGKALINVEDMVYLGASLGGTFGIMRSTRWRGHILDTVAQRAKRTTEVVRAVRWQRLAPAFGAGIGLTRVSDNTLDADWLFEAGSTWWQEVYGKTTRQKAPAIVARNIDLPTVTSVTGEVPYITAALNPNGAFSIAALPRLSTEKALHTPRSAVTIDLEITDRPVGVFGYFESLRFRCGGDSGHCRVWMQDLAADEAADVTGQVVIKNGVITIPSGLVEEIGKTADNDISDPGVVFKVIATR